MDKTQKNVLIISCRDDVHVEEVLKYVAPDVNIFLHNTDALSSLIGNECSLYFGDNGVNIERVDGLKIGLDDVSAIWYRKPYFWYPEMQVRSLVRKLDYKMKKNEIFRVIEGIMEIAERKGIRCLSNLSSIMQGENKIHQLFIAREIGLTIPKTLISNDVPEIVNFVTNNSPTGVIIKSLTGLVTYGNAEMNCETKRYTLARFLAKYGKYKKIDHYLTFQEEIHKLCDIRVTIVGDKVFACRIFSQENRLSRVDFRMVDPRVLRHEPVELPRDIQEKLLSLCKYYRLNYAAIDLVEDQAGNYYFLEINPNGQYLWIEDLAKLPISKEIATYLQYKE